MNGIHEVTGSIPVWSTILRSPFGRASDGKPSELTATRRMSTVARSAKVDRTCLRSRLPTERELRLASHAKVVHRSGAAAKVDLTATSVVSFRQ
jgi:hypothetical protein